MSALKHLTALMIVLGMSFVAQDAAAELVLVGNGESRMPIVVFADAPPFTRRAADELAEYIEKVSGARPEVLEGQPEPLPDRAIWVGYQPVLDRLFPKVDLDFQHPEEILIAANENHLVIAGRDVWEPEHLNVQLGRKTVNGVQQEYGTANAVYTFLQHRLGVRWLWPGDLGEDVLPRHDIGFEPFKYRYHPQFRARSGVFDIYDLYRQHPGHEWTRFQRVQLDSLDFSGGHGFTWWWKRFYKDHPGYFALQADGTRGTWPGSLTGYRAGVYVKTCKNNPAVWKLWLKDVEDQLAKNPNQRVFCAAANDGGYEGYCICEKCRAWDSAAGKLVPHSWRGLGQEYVAMSDRQVRFANTLGRLLKERYPDKDYYVSILAYGNSSPAPAEAIPDDNVIVGGVFGFHFQPSPSVHRRLKLDNREMFKAWARVTKNFAWRPNLPGSGGWKRGYPRAAPRDVVEDLRMAAGSNVIGLFFDSIWGHWANQGPYYYMLAQMAWNPNADGDAILGDYYRRAFGPAADTMTAYWELIEAAGKEIVFDQKTENEVWDDDFYRRAYALLDQATAETQTAPPVYTKRVDFVRAGIHYLRLLKETEPLIERMRESGGKDAQAEAAARANWGKVKKIHSDYPSAVNWVYVGPGGSRTRDLQPDYVLKQIGSQK